MKQTNREMNFKKLGDTATLKDNNVPTIWAIVQNFWYLYFCNYIYLKSWWDFGIGKQGSWNKLKRLGKNVIPT